MRRRARALPGTAVKVGLAVALAVSLGGYTVAESATQRATVEAQERETQLAVEVRRDAIAAERQRAVATAHDAIADAAAVQTVAASAVTDADLAPLTQAVDELSALLAAPEALDAVEETAATADPAAGAADVPAAGAAEQDGVVDESASSAAPPAAGGTDAEPTATADAPVVDRTARASRAAGRTAAPSPTTTDPAAPAPTTVAAPGTPDAAEAAQVTAGADAAAGTTTDPAPADGGVGDATDGPTPADDAAPEDELAARILAAVAKVTEVAAQVQATADANIAAQQAAAAAQAEADAAVAAAAAQAAAAAAAEKEAQRVSLDAYANGRIPAEALCELAVGGGHQLRCDAAEALVALDAAYQAEFGQSLTISDSYRSYAAQVACRRVKGYLCATPGTSNHGRGVAVDLAGGVQTFGTRQHRWMAANAGDYGWTLPDWASAGGSKPEPWHWEYTD